MLIRCLVVFSLLLSGGTLTPNAQAQEIVVYSSRLETFIKPIFDAYTQETGVKIIFLTDKEGALIEKLKAEGANTPADMLMTTDAGNLWLAANSGVLKPVMSKILETNVPAHLRDPDKQWFGLTVRARTIIYNPQKVKPSELSTYENLGDPKWKGRLCLRTSSSVYNQSLVAMMVAELGEEKTERIVKSWMNNLATTPFPNDTKMMEAIAAGQCDVGIGNNYYFGRLKVKNPTIPLAPFWANQRGSGVHVNISGAGITKHAKNEKEAIRFLEWLSSEKAQKIFINDEHWEYPVNPRVPLDTRLAEFGSFKQNLINVAKAGQLQVKAVMLMDRVGYK